MLQIQSLGATAALVQESVKGDSLVETNEVMIGFPKGLVLQAQQCVCNLTFSYVLWSVVVDVSELFSLQKRVLLC